MEFMRRAKIENWRSLSGLDPTAGAGWVNHDPRGEAQAERVESDEALSR
jgi:hypothetical protein